MRLEEENKTGKDAEESDKTEENKVRKVRTLLSSVLDMLSLKFAMRHWWRFPGGRT